jgi:hypothetical protein
MAITRTVQQVIDQASRLEKVDRDLGLQLINEAHNEILKYAHVIPDITVDIPLVTGQVSYALPNGLLSIWDAAYYYSENNHVPVWDSNKDTLYYDQGPNFQLQPNGIPQYFSEQGGYVNFTPAPNTTTVGTYPFIRLWYTAFTELEMFDTMPTTISSIYPWVYHICARVAVSTNPNKVVMYDALYAKEMKKLATWLDGKPARNKPRVAYNVPRSRRA